MLDFDLVPKSPLCARKGRVGRRRSQGEEYFGRAERGLCVVRGDVVRHVYEGIIGMDIIDGRANGFQSLGSFLATPEKRY